MNKILIKKPISFESLIGQSRLIASYPRSGNTWTLFLIKDILAKANEELKNNGHEINFGSDIHDIHATKNLYEKIQSKSFSGILKTHYIDDSLNNKIIYVFRKAIDVLPSYFRFHKYSGYENYDKPYSFKITNAFVKELISHWSTAIKIHSKCPNQILFLPYELLHKSPFTCLVECCRFFEIDPVSDSNIHKSIHTNAFESMKQSRSVFSEKRNNEVFMASGKVGSGKKEFSPLLKALIEICSYQKYNKMYRIASKNMR
jgi:hypothetical protein